MVPVFSDACVRLAPGATPAAPPARHDLCSQFKSATDRASAHEPPGTERVLEIRREQGSKRRVLCAVL